MVAVVCFTAARIPPAYRMAAASSTTFSRYPATPQALQRPEARLDLRALRLQKWRQSQALTQMRRILIRRKTRPISRYFIQDAIGLAKIY